MKKRKKLIVIYEDGKTIGQALKDFQEMAKDNSKIIEVRIEKIEDNDIIDRSRDD